MNKGNSKVKLKPWQEKLHQVIFEADTSAGKFFDIVLLLFILLSILSVILESVASVREKYGHVLFAIEWFFTIVFTLEYIARLICVLSPYRYATSILGMIDLISIIPTYLSFLIPGSQSLIIIRIFRLLRVFRIFKLVNFVGEAEFITKALKASRAKIIVFLITVICIVVFMGTIMYLVEGEESGFTSIPLSIYWAIVTLTTVGYGDLVPLTPLGQTIASLITITGYGIIAVPTGIVTREFMNLSFPRSITTQVCPNCTRSGHEEDAEFCKFCGTKL